MKRLCSALFAVFILGCATAQNPAHQRGGYLQNTTPKKFNGNSYALVVGINNYQSKNFKKLNYAVADAKAFVDFLKSDVVGARAENIISMYDDSASLADILLRGIHQIESWVTTGKITEKDRIFIYLSGHGGAFNIKDSYYFPYNANHAQDAGQSLSIRTIKNRCEEWAQLKGIQVIFIFDACRSATVGMGKDGIELVSKHLEANRGDMVFAASSEGMEANEYAAINHGVFTYYLLRGLYGEADGIIGGKKDGEISGDELAQFVRTKVKEYTNNAQSPFFTFPHNSYRDNALFFVNPKELAQVEERVSKNYYATTPGNSAGNLTASKSASTDLILENFHIALSKGNIIRPEKDNALYYLLQMQQTVPYNQVENHKTTLAYKLFEISQTTISNDLNGLRLYSHADNDSKESHKSARGYNLNYYQDAATALEGYGKLLPEFFTEKDQTLIGYFTARNYWLRYKETGGVRTKDFDPSVYIDTAIKIFTNLIAHSPSEAFLFQGLGECFYEIDSFSRAKECYKKAIELAPQWSYPYNSIGIYYRKLSDYLTEKYASGTEYYELGRKFYDSAHYYFRKAVQISPEDPFPYINLGDIWDDVHEHDSSAAYYIKAIKIDSAQIVAYLRLAKLCKHIKNDTLAEKFYLLALEVDSNYAQLHHDLGVLYEKYELHNKALSCYEKASRLLPNDDDCYRHRADVLYALKRVPEALAAIKKAIQIDSAASYFHDLGDYYLQLGYTDSALAAFHTTLHLQPQFTTLYAHVCNHLFDIYEKQGNDSLKLVYIKKYLLNQGYASAYEKDFKKSEECFALLLKYYKYDPWTHYHMACLNAIRGQKDKALKYLKAALDRGFDDYEMLLTDDDFANLRSLKQFKTLLIKYVPLEYLNNLARNKNS